MTSGSPVWITNITSPTATYTVTGLNPSTTYKFRVRVMDSGGLSDTNTHDLSATTASITATFNGWNGIKAVGPKTPAAQAADMLPEDASVSLSWDAVTPSSGTVTSYNIYRSATSGGQSYASPLATGISAATRSYTDNTVSASTPYYYTIAPVVAGSVVIPTAAYDSEVAVNVPPANMVLLHKWAANREMCEQMGKPIVRDTTHNYGCAMTGNPPGSVSNRTDLGPSLFVDRYEQGCNYTAANACTDATVSGGAAAPCIGMRNTPLANVSALGGSIYYSRYTGRCFFNDSGVGVTGNSWVEATSGTAAQRQAMGSVAPGLPPLVRIDQLESQEVCQGQTVAGTPSPSTKRLLTRKEQLMVAAWDGSLADATIDTMEIGLNLHSSNNCNSSYASPQGNNNTDISGIVGQNRLGFTNTVTPNMSVNPDTLPGCLHVDCVGDTTLTELIRSVRTGSSATSACVSRYGAQDLVGNVWEWTSDQISCNGTTCSGTSGGSADSGNIDFGGLTFDGSTEAPVADTTFTAYGKIRFPLGIPVLSSFAGDGTTSLTAAQLHGDRFYISNAGAGARGALAGGSWGNGSGSGRFALNLVYGPTYTYRYIGFRCALPAE
jgi:hypothetical protein